MFKTEQLSDDVTLYCGDCRDVIPTLEFSDGKFPSRIAVVSDPPYGIEELVEGYGRTALGGRTDIVRNIANDMNLVCVVEALELIKEQFDNIWLALFYSCRISPTFFQATSILEYYGEIVWDKKNIGMGYTGIRYQHENIAVFKIGNPDEFNMCSSVLPYQSLKGEKRSIHPHEKPNQVMHNICEAVPGKVILDPFMGTGSTGAAAIALRRGFIGIELDPRYFDLARKKVGDALKKPPVDWWRDE